MDFLVLDLVIFMVNIVGEELFWEIEKKKVLTMLTLSMDMLEYQLAQLLGEVLH
jgi:hypothetical protein